MGDSQKISSLVTGGAASAGPPLGPALGPLGVNIMEIINAIIVNDKVLGIGVKATVGISRNPQVKAEIHHALELASEVDEISEVTGRFDMLVRIRAKNLEELHDIVINKIGKINGIYNTETFIDLQKTEKNPTFS